MVLLVISREKETSRGFSSSSEVSHFSLQMLIFHLLGTPASISSPTNIPVLTMPENEKALKYLSNTYTYMEVVFKLRVLF